VAKRSRAAVLYERVGSWFGFENGYVVISVFSSHRIDRVLTARSAIPNRLLRCDVLRCRAAGQQGELEEVFQEFGFAAIEARIVSYESGWKQESALGFWEIRGAESVGDFHARLNEAHVDAAGAERLLLCGSQDLGQRVVLSDGDILVERALSADRLRMFGRDRVVLIVQMNAMKITDRPRDDP